MLKAQPTGFDRIKEAYYAIRVQEAVAEVLGADFSHWQGDVNWQIAKEKGLQFAFLRAGYGNSYVDSKLANNRTGCTDRNIPFGLYWYAVPGVLASALGMDKVFSKLLFRDHGLSVAEYRVFRRERASLVAPSDLPFGLPAVVKPGDEGSSVGVAIAKDADGLRAACLDAARYKGDVVVERYVKGKEIQVAVLDDQALASSRWSRPTSSTTTPPSTPPGPPSTSTRARIPPEHAQRVSRAAEVAHRALGCAGVTRSDFILTPAGELFILEVNTLPGMTPTSLVPKIAAGNGIAFPDLCERLPEGASLKA